MIELIKKTFFTGLGLAALTKEKVEEIAREVAKAAEMSSEKGQQFVDEAVKRAEQTRQEFESAIQRVVEQTLARSNLPTRQDFDRLVARIEQLEQHLRNRTG
jgi:polyhydroxyalkanoate synthesis regulator phasin